MIHQGPQEQPHINDERASRAPLFWGVIAMCGGAVLLLNQFMDIDPAMPWIMLALGAAMLGWGMATRSAGALIPGGIVTGIGLGIILIGTTALDNNERSGGLFLMVMALGFLSITLTTLLFTKETHWWALIPGGIIFAVGLAIYLGGVYLEALNLLNIAGAAALFLFGAWLIYRVTHRPQA